MRLDRRRTRGVALLLTVVVMIVTGAGGGLAVTDHGSPVATQLQTDNSTEGDADGESTGDARDSELQTESETPETQTPEPEPADAGESADASQETATATETPASADAQTATPESSDDTEVGNETDAAATETEAPDGNDTSASTENDTTEAEVNDTSASEESDVSADDELADCTEITEPGEYELAADVDGSGTCIAVQSSGVVIDGNGHTVAGSGSGTGIQVSGGVSDVTVRNVDVSDWGVAVELGGSGASGPTANLVDVRATGSDTGVRLVEADDSAMQAVTARDNGDGVVLVDTADVRASDVTVAGNDGTGLWLARGVSGSSFGIVQATDNGERGIHVATGATDNFVGDATVTDNGGAGVEFADSSNNVLADSRVERNGGPGVLSYPASGDRLENVQLADNGDGAYRDQGERAGAIADTVQLRDGASVRFDQGVTHLAATDAPQSLPDGTDPVGPAVDVTLRDGDGATATVTVPVDDAEDVRAYQRVSGSWEELDDVTVRNGEAEMTVAGSGVVVPVVATDDDPTEPGIGGDTVRADTSSGSGPETGDETAASDGAGAGDTSSDEAVAGDAASDGVEPASTGGDATSEEAQQGGAQSATGAEASGEATDSDGASPDAATEQYAAGDGGETERATADGTSERSESDRHRVVIESAGDEAPTEYTLFVDGNVSKVTNGNTTADENDTISRANGTVTVEGSTATADAYLVDGQLRGVCGTAGTPGYSLRYVNANDAGAVGS